MKEINMRDIKNNSKIKIFNYIKKIDNTIENVNELNKYNQFLEEQKSYLYQKGHKFNVPYLEYYPREHNKERTWYTINPNRFSILKNENTIFINALYFVPKNSDFDINLYNKIIDNLETDINNNNQTNQFLLKKLTYFKKKIEFKNSFWLTLGYFTININEEKLPEKICCEIQMAKGLILPKKGSIMITKFLLLYLKNYYPVKTHIEITLLDFSLYPNAWNNHGFELIDNNDKTDIFIDKKKVLNHKKLDEFYNKFLKDNNLKNYTFQYYSNL